jgi:hypothetical protein
VESLAAPDFFVWQENVFAPIKEHDLPLTNKEIPHEYYGWWRIVETSQWANDDIDIIGTALISLTGWTID